MAKQRLTGADKAERDAQIIALRSSGLSWQSIAKQMGITDRMCRRIWQEWREDSRLDIQGIDPLDVVFEQIARLEKDIETLAQIAADASDRNVNAKVGAINTKAKLYAQQVELLVAVGKMPRNLGKLAVELEANFVFRVVGQIIDEYVPQEKRPEAEQKLRTALRRERPKLAAVS